MWPSAMLDMCSKGKKVKILFVLENYHPHLGGVEILFKHLTEGLAKKGHKVTIVTHRLPGTAAYQFFNGVRIHRVDVPSFASRYFFTFLCFQKLLKVVKDVDVIHTTTYNAAVPAWIIAKLYKKPVMITVHEVIGDRWGKTGIGVISGKIHQILEWIIVHLPFDKYICDSNATESDLVTSNFNADSTRIYPGIDYKFWDPKKYDGKKIRKELGLQNKFVYLYYGRPGPSKGFNDLLHAVKQISYEVKDSHLVAILSNDSQYREALNDVYQHLFEWDLESEVTILKPVPRKELPEVIKMADVIVVPSMTEGFGFCVAEACAMRKAVVASNTGSIPEVISGRYVLVKPGNPVSIAKGVISISNRKFTKTKLKKFSWTKFIDNHRNLYKELKFRK